MISDHPSPIPLRTAARMQATILGIGGTDDASLLDWELSRTHLPLFQAACVLYDAVARRRPDKSFQILVLINGPAHWAEVADSLPHLKDAITLTAKELRRARPTAASIEMSDLYRWAHRHGVLDPDSQFAKRHGCVVFRTTRASRLGRTQGPPAPGQAPADGRGKHFEQRRQQILAAARRCINEPRADTSILKADGTLHCSALAIELEDRRAYFGLPDGRARGFSHEQIERVIRSDAGRLGQIAKEPRTLVTGD